MYYHVAMYRCADDNCAVCNADNADDDVAELTGDTCYRCSLPVGDCRCDDDFHCPLCHDTGEVYERTTSSAARPSCDIEGPFSCPRGCDGEVTTQQEEK